MARSVEEIRALVGSRVDYQAPEPLGAAAIRYYATAVGDENPLHRDAEHARSLGLPDLCAPPTLLCETSQYADLPRSATGYAGHLWDIDPERFQMLRGGNSYTFRQRVHPDLQVSVSWRLLSVEERSTRAGRPLVVVRSQATYRDQHEQLVAVNEETLLYLQQEDEQ